MSTRITASVTMSAACQQMLRRRLSLHDNALVDLGTLSEIIAGDPVELSSLRNLLSTERVTSTLASLAPEAFEHSRALLANSVPTQDSLALAASAQASLADALATASATIASTTRDITVDAFVDAGAELGYEVSVCRGPDATGIELRRPHEFMLVRVNDGGKVECDQAGLVDATCGDRERALARAVARRGISLAGHNQRDHGDPEAAG